VWQKTGTDFMESSPGFGVELLHSFLCHGGIKPDLLDMSSIISLGSDTPFKLIH
jgi:hypothetical protein